MTKLKVLDPPERSRLLDLADEWLEDVKTTRSFRTFQSYEWPVKRVLIPFMEAEGIASPADLDQATLNRLSNSLTDGSRKALSLESVRTYMRQCNIWLRWCAERDGRDKVVTAKWQKPTKKEVDYLTRSEVNALESAATTARDAVIVRTFNETGMRLGELLGLTIEDVCKGPTGPYLRVTGTKTRTKRDVPIRPPLHRLLTDYIEKKRPRGGRSNALFLSLRRDRRSGEYEPVKKRSIESMFKSLAAAAGIKAERVYPHALRHSLATHMMKKPNANVALVAALLGHSPAVLLRTYSHLHAEDARDELSHLLAD